MDVSRAVRIWGRGKLIPPPWVGTLAPIASNQNMEFQVINRVIWVTYNLHLAPFSPLVGPTYTKQRGSTVKNLSPNRIFPPLLSHVSRPRRCHLSTALTSSTSYGALSVSQPRRIPGRPDTRGGVHLVPDAPFTTGLRLHLRWSRFKNP
jgi:hypothetical protein